MKFIDDRGDEKEYYPVGSVVYQAHPISGWISQAIVESVCWSFQRDFVIGYMLSGDRDKFLVDYGVVFGSFRDAQEYMIKNHRENVSGDITLVPED